MREEYVEPRLEVKLAIKMLAQHRSMNGAGKEKKMYGILLQKTANYNIMY